MSGIKSKQLKKQINKVFRREAATAGSSPYPNRFLPKMPKQAIRAALAKAVPVQRRRQFSGRNLNNGGKVFGENYMATDGVNSSRVVTNRSTIEDTFSVRREKVANITGTAAFTISQALYINPGNSTLFPIFSQIAATYEEYRINHLEFTFETEAYTASGTVVSAGKVILATNFDPDDSNFTTDTQMENYVSSVKGPPYAPIIEHDVVRAHKTRGSTRRGMANKDFAMNNYFVYPSANTIAPGADQGKFYDAGKFQLATSGTGVAEIGELYVTYSFTMIRPKQPELGLGGGLAAHFAMTTADATAASPLGLSPYTNTLTRSGSTLSLIDSSTLVGYSSTTVGLNNSADTVITLPNVEATWLVQLYWAGTGIAGVPTVAAANGATKLVIYNNGVENAVGFFLASGLEAGITFVVTSSYDGTPVPGSTNTLTVGGLASMTAGKIDIIISRLPTTLVTSARKRREDQQIQDRIANLERLLGQNLSLVQEGFDSPIHVEEEKDLDKSVYLSRDSVRSLLGLKC